MWRPAASGSALLATVGVWLALPLGAAVGVSISMSGGPRNRPAPHPPSVGAVQSGSYRNMFLEAGYTQAAIDAKIEAAWQQLYFGDPATERIYYEVPSEGTAYLTDVKNGDVRTEGMGYGMMAMLQMNNQTGFDMIWGWVQLHMLHTNPSDPLFGWSAWHAYTNGTRMSNGPAPDGETWFITTLFGAATRWGDGTGERGFNYTKAADTILCAVSTKPGAQGMFTPAPRTIVRFDPGTSYTDPSYFLPAFYTVWAQKTSCTPERWEEAARTTREVLHASVDHSTGLAPHSCEYSGEAVKCFGDHSCQFEDDAWRVARNWAMDYHWHAADGHQLAMSSALHRFFADPERGGGIGDYTAEYLIDGTRVPGRSTNVPGLAAMNAVAALASNLTLAWDFIDALWQEPIPTGDDRDSDRYYSGCLYLEALLHLSGRYRAWL